MPTIVQAAWGNPANFTGDIHSHQVAIDPARIDQVDATTDPAGYTLAPNGLNFACRHCHGAGLGSPKTDEELLQAAQGYHDMPESTTAPSE